MPFEGTYIRKINKGKITIPSSWRKYLEQYLVFVNTQGILSVCKDTHFNSIVKKIEKNEDALAYFFSTCYEGFVSRNHQIYLSEEILEKAKITNSKKLLLSGRGRGNHIEIFSLEK